MPSHRDRIGVITFPRACELLTAAMLTKGPDYVYRPEGGDGDSTCANFVECDGGGYVPSCLVGHVWHALGLTPETCADDRNSGALLHAPANAVIDRFLLKVTPKAKAMLAATQYAQDQGLPWGKAIEQSHRVVAGSQWDDYE